MKHLLRNLLLAFSLCAPFVANAFEVVTSLTQDRVAKPGDTYEDSIVIRNSEKETAYLKLSVRDYFFNADGHFDYGPPGKLPRSNASWIHLQQEQVTVPPGQTVPVNYAVQVPNNQQLKGTYWSIILVEPLSNAEMPHLKGKRKMALQVVFRYGVQNSTTIGDTVTHQLRFQNVRLQRQGGKQSLQVELDNTGERWLSPHLWVELYDAHGQLIKRLDGKQRRLYPGTSVRLVVPIDQVAAGQYRTLLLADAGGDDLYGMQINMTLKK